MNRSDVATHVLSTPGEDIGISVYGREDLKTRLAKAAAAGIPVRVRRLSRSERDEARQNRANKEAR